MKKHNISNMTDKRAQQEKPSPLPRVLFAFSFVFGVLSLFHGIPGAVGCLISLICFLIAIWFSLRHTTEAWARAGPCAAAAFLLSWIALGRLTGLRFERIGVFLCFLPIALVLYALWRKKLPIGSKNRAEKYLKRFSLLLCLLLHSFLWAAHANVCLEAHAPMRYQGAVVSLTQTNYRFGSSCYVGVQYEENHAQRQLSFPVPLSLYAKLQEGDPVWLLRYPGAMNSEYYSLAISSSSKQEEMELQ